MAKNGSGPKDQLWEDNWDDDDVEDDFVNTLRYVSAGLILDSGNASAERRQDSDCSTIRRRRTDEGVGRLHNNRSHVTSIMIRFYRGAQLQVDTDNVQNERYISEDRPAVLLL